VPHSPLFSREREGASFNVIPPSFRKREGAPFNVILPSFRKRKRASLTLFFFSFRKRKRASFNGILPPSGSGKEPPLTVFLS